jgi:hypothetical protein
LKYNFEEFLKKDQYSNEQKFTDWNWELTRAVRSRIVCSFWRRRKNGYCSYRMQP